MNNSTKVWGAALIAVVAIAGVTFVSGRYLRTQGASVYNLPATPTSGAQGFPTGISIGTGTAFTNPNLMWTVGCFLNHNPQIQLLSPNGGETYSPGQQVPVTWRSCNMPANSLINILIENPSLSATAGLVSTYLPNTGSATVTLPTTGSWPALVYGNNFKMIVAQAVASGSYASDASDSNFTITTCSATIAPAGTPTATVESAGGTQLQPHGIALFQVPFSVTATGCAVYIPDHVTQLAGSVSGTTVQFTAQSQTVALTAGSTAAGLTGSAGTVTSNNNILIPSGQTLTFTMNETFSSPASGSYKVSLSNIPTSSIDATQYTGIMTTGYANNMLSPSSYSTPFVVLH